MSPRLTLVGQTDADAFVKMMEVAVRKYRRGEGQEAAARLALSAAINLYAEHVPAGAAALMTAELVAGLAQRNRSREGS